MPRCSEPPWCLAKHGSDAGMPEKLRVGMLRRHRCRPAEICCILHPHSNAEGFLQAVPKGFFPVRCVLVVIQSVSGSQTQCEHCLALVRGGGLELSGIPKPVLREAGAQLTRNALHKAAAPARGGAQQEPGAAAPAEQDAATSSQMGTMRQSSP